MISHQLPQSGHVAFNKTVEEWLGTVKTNSGRCEPLGSQEDDPSLCCGPYYEDRQ